MGKKRFIVIVLDSFGIGAMDDVATVRPQDIGANTCLHLIESNYKKKWTTLKRLGLINALGVERLDFKKEKVAVYGSSKLNHFGADSYFGHQEIAGTNPKKTEFCEIAPFIHIIEKDLLVEGLSVKRFKKDKLTLLTVNDAICVGDNMETDLGQAVNVIGAMDICGFELIEKVGKIVRRHVTVPRVIAFGGSNVTFEDIVSNIITKGDKYIGVDAPASGVYKDNYHVIHIGFGVDVTKQVPIALKKIGIKNYFYGKVADIVHNPFGTNFSAVDTDVIFDNIIKDLKEVSQGFFFLNIQETDLAGHAEDCERYIDRLNLSDKRLQEIIKIMDDEDIMIVMADHGNDPTIGHSKHTRENVPLLIYNKQNKNRLIDIGRRNTMADVGATVADYFDTSIEFGTSFLKEIKNNTENKY